MTRESIEEKAARLLSTGCLTATSLVGDHVRAVCCGDTGVYDLGYDPRRPGGWWCDCPVRGGRQCSHLVALQLVVVRRRPPVHRPTAPAQPDLRIRLDPARPAAHAA
ncbi:MAG: hypothetical protein ACRDPY_32245 [Streptosporangiaceae bacterium]